MDSNRIIAEQSMENHENLNQNRPSLPRMVSIGDAIKVIYIGRRKQVLDDMYVRLLGGSWKNIILFMMGVYLVINVLFAFAYLATGDGIANARQGSFSDAFFFSVQTLATIGYGGMLPHGMMANILVTIESMFAFAYYGVVTGLVFSKFSRPTSRIVFSDKAIITKHDGKPHFMLRLVNERGNGIVEASAKLTLMRDEITAEGISMRRFYDLPLVRTEIPFLRLTWMIMHEINKDSPLYNVTPEKLTEIESVLIISIVGIDETLSQTVHARHFYTANDIVCDAVFEDILYSREDYVLEVRLDRFHQLKEKQGGIIN